MKLAYIDRAIACRNYIQHLRRIRQKAQSEMITVTLGSGPENEISSHMSAEVVRQAIIVECDRLTKQYEHDLYSMGVEI